MYFKTADSDFKPDPFFDNYLTTFLPPIYRTEAEALGNSFMRQWAHEWTYLHTKLERLPRVPEVYFWTHWSHRRLLALDLTESEFYRSAFLRSLAWAAATKRIDTRKAYYHADRVCPVNLDLWQVTPREQPKWWPKGSPSTGPVDTVPSEILERVGQMWAEQSNQEWVVAATSGIVVNGDFTFETCVCGLVQACTGSEQPDLDDLFDLCQGQQVVPQTRFLRVAGPVAADEEVAAAISVGDWLVWPLASRLRHPTIPRWQWWRGARGVWAPSPLLSNGYEVTCSGDALEFRQDGDSLAMWFDWMQDFKEMYDSEMPPSTGHVLLVRRTLVEELAERRKGTFAWLCRWQAYHRKSQYRDQVDKSSGTIQLGTTRVVR